LYKSYFLKRPFDLILSALGIVISSPVWIIVSIAILMESGCPVFYIQERCGLHGKPFNLYKFRSMLKTKNNTDTVIVLDDDPRITSLGRFLRKTAIDELPSLINILKGDMSFVGPRAEPFSINNLDISTVPGYEDRIKVRPGLTGYAQIYGTRYISIEDKFCYDKTYLQKAGFFFDIKLIIFSFLITFKGKWESTGEKI